MAPHKLAWIVPRAYPAWIAVAALGALAATGCNHHRRTALRPVFTSPGAVAAPCNNCGTSAGGATIVRDEPAPMIRGGAPSRSLSSEPTFSEPSGGATDSSVPNLDAPSSESFPTSRQSVPPEAPPKATIDRELDLSPVPSASQSRSEPTRSRSLRVPLDPKPDAGAGVGSQSPALQGPGGNSGPTTWNDAQRARAPRSTGLVKQASAPQRLESFLGERGSDDLYYPSKADRPWRYVVLHQSATPTGNYDQIDAEHRRILGFDGCGYHFVIGNGTGSGDGQIEVAQRWVNQKHGVHCQNARKAEIDEYGIGICLIGDFDKAPPTPKQIAAAKLLIAHLSQRYQIADDRIETHAHLAATPTVCPGGFFPNASVFRPGGAMETETVENTPATNRAVPTALRVRTGGRGIGTPSR